MMDEQRGTGRTTGLALKAIGEASLAAGGWVEFIDHIKHTHSSARMYVAELREMASLYAPCTKVRRDGSRVFLRSTVMEVKEAE